MDSDTEVENIFTKMNGDDDDEKQRRPPSSYGSMKSESDDMEDIKEEQADEVVVAVLPDPPVTTEMGMQMNRSMSPETLYTIGTEQTKPPGAMVLETSSLDFENLIEEDEEDEDEILYTCSPEPPELLDLEDSTSDESSQPGKMHPEQDLAHIFKSMQKSLSGLTSMELLKFQIKFHDWQRKVTMRVDGDVLDFVDMLIEQYGLEHALRLTIETLQNIGKREEAEELKQQCHRALSRFEMNTCLIAKHRIIHEGVPQPGKQAFLNNIYVEPELSRCGYGGIDPSHELLQHPPTPVQLPSPDTFIGVNDLFRLKKQDGTPVRTVVTTGLAGVGKSVCAAKYGLDWAEGRANRDQQFVLSLPFRSFWYLRDKNENGDQPANVSFLDVLSHHLSNMKGTKYLDKESHNFLFIMDCFDCYNAPLDWENAPVISSVHTKAHVDDLVVNIIRGTLLPGARLWILGRRAAVTQIPSKFIDEFTELQGFSDSMKDEYLTKQFNEAELATQIVRQSKRVSTLHIFGRHPFFLWIMAVTFKRCFGYLDYGQDPPRITPFYIHMMTVQINRRLQFYHGRPENQLRWSDQERNLVKRLGKLAFKMLEKKTSVFYEEDVKDYDLELREVVVNSGMVTELTTTAPDGGRSFSFFHFTFQEFLAALYVFLKFHTESKNILDSSLLSMPKFLTGKYLTKSAAGLIQYAFAQALNSPQGHYDLFLRFLCGFLNPHCHHTLLAIYFYPHNFPKVAGLGDVQELLEQAIKTAPEDRVGNLRECLREMIQSDE
ncbi:protein NLRC3 [Melanotaenia boesemani]|uniref:protein NLRC3 n=1 Tax=Melanotaenia boesemani TaxID=1250792 RepID=UPI001C057E56|nr:protein NLRC3 [Melanotaenia boesemani]